MLENIFVWLISCKSGWICTKCDRLMQWGEERPCKICGKIVKS